MQHGDSTRRYLLAVVAAHGLIPFTAQAGSVSGTISITMAPPASVLVISPSIASLACEVTAGTMISALSTTGGDGNRVTFWLAGDTTDFVLSGADVVVGPNGIAAANCNATQTVTAAVKSAPR